MCRQQYSFERSLLASYARAVELIAQDLVMCFGTLNGEMVVIDHKNGYIVSQISPLGAMNGVWTLLAKEHRAMVP
ncbi:hypothetical protein VNO77_02704 [Canavalia gladiata]|uniref:Uncharacterized protein n=1 Tax=Canavalia gladiata TaxID=3824 RepID=A0AAN9R394_CANGL